MKKSRKRLLISSVAMLLVAMLALGTATFAWFTSSTSITADQINVYTTKSSELELSKSDLNWSKTGIHYGMTSATKLAPVSSLDGTNWFSAYAEASNAKGKASTANYSAVSTPTDGYIWTEMLNINNAGGQAANVTITVSATTFSSAARLAIIPVDVQSEANTMSSFDAAGFQGNIYGIASDEWYPAISGKNASETKLTTQGNANGATINVGQLAAEGGKASYRLIVWFEGEDADCYDNYTGGFAVPAISFSVSGTAV